MRRVRVCLTFLAAAGICAAQITVHLSNRTNQAFETYVQTAEAGMDWRPNPAGIAPWAGKSPIPVEDGMIHDWVSSVFVPRASTQKALSLFQSYDDYKKIFAPEVIDSKLLKHEGNRWWARLRLKRKKVLTVVLDGDYDIEYRPLADGKWAILSRSTRIAEVDDDKELAPGSGSGFLWRLNAYWLIAPRQDGVELDCRTISLSRDIPAGLGWMVGPIVSSVPRESLRNTAEAVERALR